MRASAAAGVPAGELAQRLGRPLEQVRRRRRRLAGPRASPRSRYSAADDERLRAGWAGNNTQALADELGRSAGSVRLRAQTLGLHRPQPRRRRQPGEDDIVRDGYERALSCEQIATLLPGRNAETVTSRAAKLGIATYARVWSQLDEQRLRVLSSEGLPVEWIAQALGRTPQALLLKAHRLGVALPAPGIPPRSALRWTAAEDDVLRVHAALNPAVLADLLGRSHAAVTQRMLRLGLRNGRTPHHPAARRGALTPGERVTAVRELRAGGPARALAVARRLHVSPVLIRAAAAESSSPGAARARSGDL